VSSAIVVGLIYVGLNMTLSALANRLEQRHRRTAVRTVASPGASATVVSLRYM
jgi:glutamate transport system permease protein